MGDRGGKREGKSFSPRGNESRDDQRPYRAPRQYGGRRFNPQQRGIGQDRPRQEGGPRGDYQAGRPGSQSSQSGPGPSQPDRGFQRRDQGAGRTFSQGQQGGRPSHGRDQSFQQRPDFKPGSTIAIRTNHLSLSLDNYDIIAYHYDLKIFAGERQIKANQRLREIWNEFVKQNFSGRNPSFDGKCNVYSKGALPEVGEGEWEKPLTLNEEFRVCLKLGGKVELAAIQRYVTRDKNSNMEIPQKAVNVVDVVIKNYLANVPRIVQKTRMFFSPLKGTYDLGDGVEMWHGFFSSAILGGKCHLNVDISQKGFCKSGDLITLMKELGYDVKQPIKDNRRLKDFIIKLKVSFQIPGEPPSKKRTKVVCDVTTEAANVITFPFNNVPITVAAYHEREKGYRLRYPHLPCLKVGNPERNTLIPVELCTVLEGQMKNALSPSQQANMIKEAVTGPSARKERIHNFIEEASYKTNPFIDEFGVSIGGEFEKVTAKILMPPVLEYSNNEQVRPNSGVWYLNNAKFLTPAKLAKWCVLNLDSRTRPDALGKFQNEIFETAQKCGMNPEEPSRDPMTTTVQKLEDTFKQLQKSEIRIVFVVIPDMTEVYNAVKTKSEIYVGILTQCIKGKTIFPFIKPATATNILLKVNAKLNGVNHTLLKQIRPKCFDEPIMLIGADVTHQGRQKPSIAAVVASHDPVALFKYNWIRRVQEPLKEIISGLDSIVVQHLKFFYQQTKGQKPHRIIYLRDGVSESQISKVLETELRAIQKAFKIIEKDGSYDPPVTFILVQKRHHTRFFPDDSKQADKNGNVPVGTCVDTDIVDNRIKPEFYLLSHQAIRGTARPTKYKVIYDDAKMSEEEVEKLVYYLCHLFTRCPRSVSYPAPTYYAHLAAFRALAYSDSGTSANQGVYQRFRELFPMHFV